MNAEQVNFNWVEKTVIICRYCKGTGKQEEQISMDESKTVDCKKCNGTGRVTKTVTVLYEPYEAEA